jgi:hypothetical protein
LKNPVFFLLFQGTYAFIRPSFPFIGHKKK